MLKFWVAASYICPYIIHIYIYITYYCNRKGWINTNLFCYSKGDIKQEGIFQLQKFVEVYIFPYGVYNLGHNSHGDILNKIGVKNDWMFILMVIVKIVFVETCSFTTYLILLGGLSLETYIIEIKKFVL